MFFVVDDFWLICGNTPNTHILWSTGWGLLADPLAVQDRLQKPPICVLWKEFHSLSNAAFCWTLESVPWFSLFFSHTSLPKCHKNSYVSWCAPKKKIGAFVHHQKPIKPWASPATDRWGSALNEEMAKWTDEEISQCWASTQGVIRALHRGPVKGDRKRPGWKITCVYTCTWVYVYDIYWSRYRYRLLFVLFCLDEIIVCNSIVNQFTSRWIWKEVWVCLTMGAFWRNLQLVMLTTLKYYPPVK